MFLIALSQLAFADTITLDTGVAIEGDLARYEFGGDCQISVTEGDLGGVIVIVPCRRVASFVRTEVREPEVIGRVDPPAAPPAPVAPPAVAAAPPVAPPAPVALVAAPVEEPAPVEAQVVADAPYAGEPVYELPVDPPPAPVAAAAVAPAAPPVAFVQPPPPVAVAPEPTALERLGLSEDTEPFLPASDWQAPAMGSIDPEEDDEDATPSAPPAAKRPVSF